MRQIVGEEALLMSAKDRSAEDAERAALEKVEVTVPSQPVGATSNKTPLLGAGRGSGYGAAPEPAPASGGHARGAAKRKDAGGAACCASDATK